MIEALSVLPSHRGNNLGKEILAQLANEYPKAQSLWLMAMPMHYFIDPQACGVR